MGYRGSYGRVSAYLREKRTSPRPVAAQPPAPRVVTRWILSRPETLTQIEQLRLKATCDTRETVLKRDGSGVVTDSSCATTSGSWYSPYDGATWHAASDLDIDIDIDHMVPLSEAWASGAWAWSTTQRQNFANDRTRPQLLAVTDNVNQSKGDQDPGTWWPSVTSYKYTYARAWVQVKYYYGLKVDSTEKSALSSVLNGC